MTILEKTIIPKNPAQASEDGIIVSPDFVAVIDGSTSKGRLRCHRAPLIRQRSNGELAMRIVGKYISKMPKDISWHQFCRGATLAVRDRYKKSLLPHLAEHPEDRLTASCVVFSRLRREIWMIGDCQCLVDGQLFDNPKPSEAILAQERAAIIKASPQPWEHFLHDDTARQAIIPHMLETMHQQNNGYSVIDGFPVDEKHIRIITLDFQPKVIVLASDGYPFLCPTLAESETRLQEQREKDPLNIGPDFLATKAFAAGNNSFDDRSYIRFMI